MVTLPKPDVDPSSEQDMSETGTLLGTQDTYESVPPKIRGAPTNHLRVFKNNGGIEGQYFIDLSIPPVPQLASGAKNVSLHTKNGTVTADFWVTGNNTTKRTSMKLCSENGHVYTKIRDVFSQSYPRPSLDLNVQTTYGDISLSLPRCFRGPITIHTSHDHVAFSPAFEERLALISDVQGVRVYFVGNRPRSGKWRGGTDTKEDAGVGGSPEEPLDELSVSGWHSSVRIRWDGEPELRYMKQDGWVDFCMGTARFFTKGRVN